MRGKYATILAHTAGRYQRKKFRKAQVRFLPQLIKLSIMVVTFM